ncbi:hypothetical protein [Thiobacillus denitrificans]|uniref:Uncharacterized protein n=1 Tax=Thiobacillus denitrificans TaxID=36861 RepID=A0A106BPD0_THIDE|nr:hypothetical protein [Thiobacillus denitrificans]KVW96176.1 hypothetical protein ABW22_09140 [Thiobacillus denitrificans]
MALLTGFLAASSVYGYDRLYLTGDLDDYAATWINNLVYWAAVPSPGAALLASNLPVSTTPYAKSGAIARSYFDDFYNRVHVAPAVLNIGNLLSVQTRQVTVWNAYFTSQALASIGESGTVGLTESGIVAPTTFAPLEERTYSVTVATEGPATIGALYTFAFPLESPTLAVTGRRVVIFGHAPNWAAPVTEKLNWLTDVMLAQGGIEQRVGLRDAPRRALAYDLATLDRHQTNVLETMLLGWQARLWAVPVWTDAQNLAADLAAGSLAIPATTSDYEFAADGLALLWAAHDRHEAVEVASVGGASLTLKTATVAAWPAGTRLYPILLGRMPPRQKFTRETGHHLSGGVEFSFDDNVAIVAADSGDLYAGYYVYAGRTNWADPTEVEFVRQVDELDYETSHAWVDDLSGLAAILKSWHWLFKNRAEIVAFRGWLAARAGRRVPFWSISQAVDMEVLTAIGASATTITVRNIGYARYLNGRADRRHIVIRTTSGTLYYRSITASSEIDAGSEDLAIDSALGVTLQPADIESVRFMHLTRLDGDAIEIDWQHLGVAECSTMLRSLPQ